MLLDIRYVLTYPDGSTREGMYGVFRVAAVVLGICVLLGLALHCAGYGTPR